MARVPSLPVRTLRVVVALLLLGQTGCATQRAATSELDDSKPLVFANESNAQAEVWVLSRNVKTRPIGTVMAGATETLRVPSVYYGEGAISFYTRLRGTSAAPGIYDLPVSADDSLRIRLPRDRRGLVVSR